MIFSTILSPKRVSLESTAGLRLRCSSGARPTPSGARQDQTMQLCMHS